MADYIFKISLLGACTAVSGGLAALPSRSAPIVR